MENSDIKELINMLRQAQKFEDWELVQESIDYLRDLNDEQTSDDEELEE